MQVIADWNTRVSAREFEAEFNGLKFEGPGFYLTKTDTMLVIPAPAQVDATNVWNWEWPDDTNYFVYVYNVPFEQTIFAVTAVAPARLDTRQR
jgi:hypothetical protein